MRMFFRIPRKTRLRFLSLSSFDQRLYWLQHTVPYNMNLSTHSVTYILKTFCEFLSWSLWRSNTFTKSVKKVKNWRSCYGNLNEYLVFQQKNEKKWKVKEVCLFFNSRLLNNPISTICQSANCCTAVVFEFKFFYKSLSLAGIRTHDLHGTNLTRYNTLPVFGC